MKENAAPPHDLLFFVNIYIYIYIHIIIEIYFSLCIKAHDIYLSLINVKNTGHLFVIAAKRKHGHI